MFKTHFSLNILTINKVRITLYYHYFVLLHILKIESYNLCKKRQHIDETIDR